MADIQETPDPNVVAFMADLTTLSRKHGVFIHGCGCCGSPVIQPFSDEFWGMDINGVGYAVRSVGGDFLAWHNNSKQET